MSVVSPEQLLTLLEARELSYRVRLDAIVQDVADMRDRLARLDLTPAKASPPRGGKAQPKTAHTSRLQAGQAFVFADAPVSKPPTANTPAANSAAAPAVPKAGDKPAAKPPLKLVPGAEPGDVDTPANRSGAEPGEDNGSPAWAARGLASPPVVVEQTEANSLQSRQRNRKPGHVVRRHSRGDAQ